MIEKIQNLLKTGAGAAVGMLLSVFAAMVSDYVIFNLLRVASMENLSENVQDRSAGKNCIRKAMQGRSFSETEPANLFLFGVDSS